MNRNKQAHDFLKEADWLIITLGSSFSYRLTQLADHRFQKYWGWRLPIATVPRHNGLLNICWRLMKQLNPCWKIVCQQLKAI